MPDAMTSFDRELAELVTQLDGDDHNAAEEAEWTLKQHGSRALDLLLERAPSFGRFGKLCAIELFEHIGDPRASVVLIPMLRDGCALTALGARANVVPPLVAARAQRIDPIGQAWSVADLVAVIEELAAAQQRILSVQVYTRNAGAYGWRVDVDVDWPELDLSLPWSQSVAEAREAALDVATHPRVPADAYATLSWIDRTDA